MRHGQVYGDISLAIRLLVIFFSFIILIHRAKSKILMKLLHVHQDNLIQVCLIVRMEKFI